MTQYCEATIEISNIQNPSTIRDYLNAYFKQDEHKNILGEKIVDTDVWRDNDEVYITIWANAEVDFIPGSKGSYWEPAELPYIEGCLTEADFLNLIDKVLNENFSNEDYILDMDDASIPSEEELLDTTVEDYYYDEY